MQTKTNQLNATTLQIISVAALNECHTLLEEISSTCCQPQRSPTLNQISKYIQYAIAKLEDIKAITDSFNIYIEQIETCGSWVGKLHVSCCTPTREPMYQKILKHLNLAHSKLQQLLGYTH